MYITFSTVGDNFNVSKPTLASVHFLPLLLAVSNNMSWRIIKIGSILFRGVHQLFFHKYYYRLYLNGRCYIVNIYVFLWSQYRQKYLGYNFLFKISIHLWPLISELSIDFFYCNDYFCIYDLDIIHGIFWTSRVRVTMRFYYNSVSQNSYFF